MSLQHRYSLRQEFWEESLQMAGSSRTGHKTLEFPNSLHLEEQSSEVLGAL